MFSPHQHHRQRPRPPSGPQETSEAQDEKESTPVAAGSTGGSGTCPVCSAFFEEQLLQHISDCTQRQLDSSSVAVSPRRKLDAAARTSLNATSRSSSASVLPSPRGRVSPRESAAANSEQAVGSPRTSASPIDKGSPLSSPRQPKLSPRERVGKFFKEKLLRTSSSSSLPRASEGSAEVEQITQSESAGMSSSDGNIAIIKTGKQGAFGVALSTVKVRSSSVAAISGSPSSSGPGTPEAVRACSPDSEEGSATAFMVVKKDEESAFPGFKVSTMARRDNAVSKKRATVADGAVFIPQIKMPSATSTTATTAAQKTSPKTSPRVFSSANRSPRGPKSPRQGGTDIASDDEYEFGETESASAVSQLLDEQQVEPPPPFPDLPEAPPLEMSQDELMDAIAPAARDRLSHSTKTGRLDMSGFLLGFIPSNIPLNIAQLNLAANNISELKAGESLPFLRRLAELDLSFNPLNKFFRQQAEAATKPGLVLPASLTNLSLRNCLLEELPPKSILAQAAQLSGMDIRFNGIKLLSRIPCPQLVEFIANFNLFDTVDAQAFQECRNTLRSVELSNNKIRTLDAAAVTDLCNVERLLLSNNRISALPPTIGQLSAVTTLELSNNMLHSLPSEFGKLRNLRVLRCRGNRIVNVKFSFSDLVNLRLADMSYNQLSEVPDLSGAVNLRTVMLSGNPLFTLSNVEWGKLPLTILICSGTLIEDVPSALLAHRSTEVMYLGYNQKVRTIGSLLLNRTLKILNVSGCGGAEGFVVPPDFVSAEDNSKLISVAAFGASSPGGLSCLRGFGPEVRITVQPKASGSTRAALAETIGLRPAMEDRSVIAESVGPGAATVLCIFDGHGGVNAAEYCSSKIVEYLEQPLTSGEDLLVAFERIFVALDEEVSKSSFSGCTALVVVIIGRDCYHANVGDARCVVVRDGQPVQLSVNHSTTNTEEVERVRASGGVVLNGRVDGIIEVTRALGDAGVPLCIPNPYVCHTKLVEGDVMILGCDGIFDEISNDVLASMVTSTVGDAQYIASRVRDEAFFLGSGDNLSCICYKV